MKAQRAKPVLITGGAGFIGSNLAHRLAAEGRRVRVLDALSRPGVERNLEWLTQLHGDLVEPVIGDVRSERTAAAAARGIDAAFHLAAQVAVTTSLSDPRADLDINVGGTFNLLDAVRRLSPGAAFVLASTNKVYGDLGDCEMVLTANGYAPKMQHLAQHGVAENQPLDFHTPYGCSKGAADQYALDYARSFGLRAAVIRMSCIYGERQMGTEDQGWVAHFLIRALEGEPITLYGDGNQVRDVCDVADTCAAYLAAWRNIDRISGRAFNWGGGPNNAVSLKTMLREIERLVGGAVRVRHEPWRPGDQRWFVADTRAIEGVLGVAPTVPWRKGLKKLADWLGERGAIAPVKRHSVVAGLSA
jgi:CDP-paratose 2-epimerase